MTDIKVSENSLQETFDALVRDLIKGGASRDVAVSAVTNEFENKNIDHSCIYKAFDEDDFNRYNDLNNRLQTIKASVAKANILAIPGAITGLLTYIVEPSPLCPAYQLMIKAWFGFNGGMESISQILKIASSKSIKIHDELAYEEIAAKTDLKVAVSSFSFKTEGKKTKVVHHYRKDKKIENMKGEEANIANLTMDSMVALEAFCYQHKANVGLFLETNGMENIIGILNLYKDRPAFRDLVEQTIITLIVLCSEEPVAIKEFASNWGLRFLVECLEIYIEDENISIEIFELFQLFTEDKYIHQLVNEGLVKLVFKFLRLNQRSQESKKREAFIAIHDYVESVGKNKILQDAFFKECPVEIPAFVSNTPESLREPVSQVVLHGIIDNIDMVAEKKHGPILE